MIDMHGREGEGALDAGQHVRACLLRGLAPIKSRKKQMRQHFGVGFTGKFMAG